MSLKLFFSAVSKFILGLVLVGVLLFLPAGTLAYPHAWLFMALLFLPMLILGTVLFVKAPALLQKRLDAREKEKTQRGVVAAAGLLFIVGFVVAGLDFRFSLSPLPTPAVAVAAALLLLSYALYAEVMRENAYLSRKIEVQKGQKIIDTGLYGVVRHPMYAASVLLFLSIPVVLGSGWSLLCFLPYLPVIIIRILNEEKLLSAELEGYTEYKKRVRYRLIPFVW